MIHPAGKGNMIRQQVHLVCGDEGAKLGQPGVVQARE